MDFIFVKYGNNSYPEGIVPGLVEVAGHLDKDSIEDHPDYSLHTEYSYGARKFASSLIEHYPKLKDENKDGVPQLWKDEEWAEQFADFVIELTEPHAAPRVVEIHPPFSDYSDIERFIGIYKTFEKNIHDAYPDTDIVIENRAGSVYHGGRFIVSTAKEVASLCDCIDNTKTKLGVVLDFPQLLTAEHIKTDDFNRSKYTAAIDTIYPYQHLIKGIHIWGKKKSSTGRWVAHNGTLDTYIEKSEDKAFFIEGIRRICSDGRTRFFVPEVNSGEEDLKSVVNDVLS